MRVLWLSTVWPDPPVSGGRLRSFQTLRALSELADVTVLATADPGTDPAALRRLLPGTNVLDPVEVPTSVRRDPLLLGGVLVRALRTRQPYRTAKWSSPAFAAQAAALVSEHDLAYVNYLGTIGALGGLPAGRFVYEAHNVEHVVSREVADASSPLLRRALAAEAARVRAVEEQVARRAEHVLAISQEDADHLARMGARVTVVPPESPALVPRSGLGTGVLVLGTYGWSPTERATRALVPALGAVARTAPVHAVGAGAPPSLVRALERVGVAHVGFVEDLEPWWRSARVAVVPGAGSGARLRFVEAFRRGVPVVACRDAAAGLPSASAALLVDRPHDVEHAVRRVLGDDGLARDLAERGRRASEREHSTEVVRRRVARALDAVLIP